mmetsp:Transcript_9884/g.19604  ORF Transcript_9884/g.19604 Transcript_9884/m.19604 type:complete len:152 (+) Transcript_9884:1877-2332(+)
MAYVYNRRYTRMNIWDRIKAYKDKDYEMPDIDFHALSMFPPKSGRLSMSDSIFMARQKKMNAEISLFEKLNPDFDLSKKANLDTAFKFLKRKAYWMRRGLSDPVAYRKTAEEYAPALEKERRFAAIIAASAKASQARSFMDQYEELAVHRT